MRIQELEKLVGADRATIRYYEKEGLIIPQRSENGYRDYTEENACELMRILLLRKLGMSIYTISKLQQGSASFSEALDNQIRHLTVQIEEQKRARALCQVIRSDGVAYGDLDANHYFRVLEDMQKEASSVSPRGFKEDLPRECHPWRRFFARWIDLALASQLVHFIIVEVLWIRPVPGNFVNSVITVLLAFALVPAEAFMLSRWGTTPGKYVMGMRIEAAEGGLLNWNQALQREWMVLRDGLCFQIPFLTLWSQLRCYSRLTGRTMHRFARREDIPEPEEMNWDENTERLYLPLVGKRCAALAAILALIIGCSIFLAGESLKPKYRTNELTIAQFTENYNHFAKLLEENPDAYDRLNPDGTKRGAPGAYSSTGEPLAVIVMGSDFYEEALYYETINEKIRAVTLSRSWENSLLVTPMNHETAILVYSMLLSQKGTGFRDLKEISRRMDEQINQPEGLITYGGIEISWTVTAENYSETYNGTYYASQDEDASMIMIFSVRFT